MPVDSKLAVEGFSDIYALGDTRACARRGWQALSRARAGRQSSKGHYLGKTLKKKILDGAVASAPFVFRKGGNTAVIGRNAAIFDFGSWRLKGRLAWFLWAIVHVFLLVSFEKRLLVSIPVDLALHHPPARRPHHR